MTVQEIFEIISGHAREVVIPLESHEFKMEESLRDLGANSIDRSEIVMMTMETLSLNIPMIEIAGAENIGELATILHEKLAAA